MRCPKCGYISFDHNQICPKCNKDISDEQAKLNLPTYKSNPPALLGMLVGTGDDANVGFALDSGAALGSSGMSLDFDEASTMLENSSLDFGEDDQDLEISLNNDTGEFELPEIGLAEDMGEIDLGDEELSLEMDEVSSKDSDETSDDLGFDLGDISNKLSEEAEETVAISSVTGKDEKKAVDGHSTVELNVSDLKINETGELEVNSIPDEIYSPNSLPEEEEVNIDKIDVDSEDDIELNGTSHGKKNKNNKTGSLELSDLKLNASDSFSLDEVIGSDTAEINLPENNKKDEKDNLNLGDLAIGENEETTSGGANDSDDKGFDLGELALETGELNISDFEESNPDEDSFADSEKTVGFDDELKIDLENLDLDLNLDDLEDKK